MKILCIIDRLCTPGGAERQLVTLSRALAARGHECTIAALFQGSDLAKDLPQWGIRFHELGVKFQRDFAGSAARVARLVRRGGFDVVQAHLLTSCIASGVSLCSRSRCAAVIEGRVIIQGRGDKSPFDSSEGFRYGETNTSPFSATPSCDCR